MFSPNWVTLDHRKKVAWAKIDRDLFGIGFYDIIAIMAGCVQTILYCDFFYLYITKVLKGKKLQLPA